MTNSGLMILLIAPPGRYRDSLRVLLSAAGWIPGAGVADNVEMGMAMIANNAPDLVLLDAGLPDGEAWVALENIKNNFPEIRCLVLTHTKQDFITAQLQGADDILPDGFSSQLLFDALQRLASEEIC